MELTKFYIPSCHNCLQSALYQLEKDKADIQTAIAFIKAAQKTLHTIRNHEEIERIEARHTRIASKRLGERQNQPRISDRSL
jgi:hypothetical protein